MTIAVAEALMDTMGGSDDEVRRALVKSMQKWGHRYPNAGYGGIFYRWRSVQGSPADRGGGAGLAASPWPRQKVARPESRTARKSQKVADFSFYASQKVARKSLSALHKR